MTLSILLNGDEYEGFDESFAERNIETAASSFGFATTSKTGSIIPIREGDLVEIYADGHRVITGYIDEYDVSYDDKSHAIVLKGRSTTQDFVDSTVPAIKEWEDYSLFALINTIAENFNTKVIDIANVKETFKAVMGAELGETCFDFCEKFCRRRQVLLTDDENGNLVIDKPNLTVFENSLQNVKGSDKNNIKSGRRSVNLANLFGLYIAQIQGAPINVDEFESFEDLIQTADQVRDDEIRSTRFYEFYAEEVITIDTIDSITALKERAQWEMAIRRARNFVYSAVVAGHSHKGKLWIHNKLYQIKDDFCNISGEFFCNNIRYDYNLGTGSTTTLNFTNKNSYTLQSERDKILLSDE